jgi:hypothetical protein
MTSSYERMKKLLALKVEALVLVVASVLGGEYLNSKHPMEFSWHLVLVLLAALVIAYRIFDIARGSMNGRKK